MIRACPSGKAHISIPPSSLDDHEVIIGNYYLILLLLMVGSNKYSGVETCLPWISRDNPYKHSKLCTEDALMPFVLQDGDEYV